MLTARGLGALTVLTSAAMLASVEPALAGDWYGDIDCGQSSYAGCELGAGQHGRDTPAPPVPHPGEPTAPGAAPHSAPGDRILGEDTEQPRCSYVRSDYQAPAHGVRTAGYRPRPSGSAPVRFVSHPLLRPHGAVSMRAQDQGGAWYVYRCSGQGTHDALYRAPVWIRDGQVPGAAPSPEQLARRARAQLRLPDPAIASSPAGTQLVRLPTWLWLDRAMWQPRSATASVPAVSVTATATPTSVSWVMGDGSTVTCFGPGTPFPAHGDPRAASPDCGHTFQRSSATSPGERFPATATVSWRITWSGGGASGTLPDLTTTTAVSFRVAESQALGTG